MKVKRTLPQRREALDKPMPCPFCKSAYNMLVVRNLDEWMYVRCGCGVQTDARRTCEDAIKLWNARYTTPPPKKSEVAEAYPDTIGILKFKDGGAYEVDVKNALTPPNVPYVSKDCYDALYEAHEKLKAAQAPSVVAGGMEEAAGKIRELLAEKWCSWEEVKESKAEVLRLLDTINIAKGGK